jgi:hypothetical protein
MNLLGSPCRYGDTFERFRHIPGPWVLLFFLLTLAPMCHAQIVGAQDLFTYTTSNINGHASTTGTGKWSAITFGPATSISTSGSQAVMVTNGGTPGAGSAVASLPFTSNTNTVYTLTTTLKFNGPIGAVYDAWAGVGFSNVPNGGNQTQNSAPWMLIRPQATLTDVPQTAAFIGNGWLGASSVASSNYSAPIAVTIEWNTGSGVTQYFVNNTLEFTGTTAVPSTSGSCYTFLQAYQTGTAVNVSNTTLSAETVTYSGITMQDNFTNVSASIGGQAPSGVFGSGWSGNWVTNTSIGTISTSGSQAVIVTGNGVSGTNGNAIASFPFTVTPNTFYTIRTAFAFAGPVGSGPDCWGGVGFSNSTSGGNTSQNTAPWMLIRPQGLSTDNPATVDFIGNQSLASGTVPAASFALPVTATVTWDTSTGEAKYYVNDLLQATGTTALPSGKCYAYFQGYQTGTAVSLNTIAMTAQQLPLAEMWFAPGSSELTADFPAIIDSGTIPCTWPTAKSHTKVFNAVTTFFWQSGTKAQVAALIAYLKQNNIKMAVTAQPLLKGTTGCNQGEGYDYPYSHTWAIQNIVAAGGTIDYLGLDSPLGDGCVYNGTCALSIATAAQQTVNTINLYKAAFPNLKVIDFDSFAYIPTADNVAWFADLQALMGKPLDGIMNDYNWYLDYPGQLPGTAATCAAAGVSYGAFDDGFSGVLNGNQNASQYALGQLINMQSYNASMSPAPVRGCIATWTVPGVVSCPETSGTTLAALMNLTMTSPYVLQTPPVALYFLLNTSSIINYTSSYTQYQTWIAAGYIDKGAIIGLAQKSTFGGLSGLVPFYEYYNSSKKYYAFSLSAADSSLSANGYNMQTSLGYVFPTTTGSATGGMALYEYYKASANQYSYSTSSTVPSGFVSDGIIAYGLPGFYHNSFEH